MIEVRNLEGAFGEGAATLMNWYPKAHHGFQSKSKAENADDHEAGLLDLALPAVHGGHGSVDLHADRQVARDNLAGEPVGVGAVAYGGPRDQHDPCTLPGPAARKPGGGA